MNTLLPKPPELESAWVSIPLEPAARTRKWRQRFGKLCTWDNVSKVIVLLGPWVCYMMVETLNNNQPFHSLNVLQIFLNLLWYYGFFLVARILTGRRHLPAVLVSGVCFLFGLVNHYVLTFRGRIIFPCDLLGLQTAANVAADYDYTPDRAIWTAAAYLMAYWSMLLFGWMMYHVQGRQRFQRRTLIAGWSAVLAFLIAFFCTPLLPAIGIYAQQWKTQANGFLLNFMTALRYSFVSEPDGYSSKYANAIAGQWTANTAVSGAPPENLIVIMNESFADMEAQFPELELSSDPLQYFHSLTENTVKGTLISPVTGGGTANVEFEYLTGDSLAFLPSSTVAYQLYLYDGVPSLVSQVKDMGYHTIAFHPYLSSGWNRTSVYPWMGFDQQWYEDDVQDPRYIRRYVSDQSDFEQIYRATDETDGPLFMFNVTMQNHSGYAQGWNNLERSVEVIGIEESRDAASQYFSLIKASDAAIQDLIEHYSASDERTMVVFFGDHQPPLSNDFYQALYGKDLDSRTTEEVLQQYGVPFFIWANYDIPEEEDLVISSNYLGTLTARLAGFQQTPYQRLQSRLMEVLPVATTVGFMTADGTVTDDESALPEDVQALYEQYRQMAYNHLFDEKHHPDGFYGPADVDE